jgi:SARP family transcriptional regulator, regulator of embCAB operon
MLAGDGETRLQVCGRLVLRIRGERIEGALPGRQGRLAFVYLAVNRHRPVPREELIDALWPREPPAAADSALSAILSKLRAVVGAETLAGRGELTLRLPPGAWVDLEAAGDAVHRAESAVARGDWHAAWGPARVALHVARRGFLPREDADWVRERRFWLHETCLRADECVAAAGLGIGGPELDAAIRSGRELVRLAPHRESGYRVLMQALAAQGNAAEALDVYDALRRRLRDDLGIAPGAASQELHRSLLGS